MGKYFLSVICGAMLCAIVGSTTDKKGASGGVLRLISGIFLTFIVIQPIATVKIEELSIFTTDLTDDAKTAAAIGEEISQDALVELIKQETQAYILDKATGLGGDISAEVTVDESMIPRSVVLTGSISPYARVQLEDFIASDLGIPKENQLWNE